MIYFGTLFIKRLKMYQITKIGNENENRNIQLVIIITSPLG